LKVAGGSGAKAKDRFIEFFVRRALVTRAQTSLARMKHALEQDDHAGIQAQEVPTPER
jgi:hypothetical protein